MHTQVYAHGAVHAHILKHIEKWFCTSHSEVHKFLTFMHALYLITPDFESSTNGGHLKPHRSGMEWTRNSVSDRLDRICSHQLQVRICVLFPGDSRDIDKPRYWQRVVSLKSCYMEISWETSVSMRKNIWGGMKIELILKSQGLYCSILNNFHIR